MAIRSVLEPSAAPASAFSSTPASASSSSSSSSSSSPTLSTISTTVTTPAASQCSPTAAIPMASASLKGSPSGAGSDLSTPLKGINIHGSGPTGTSSFGIQGNSVYGSSINGFSFSLGNGSFSNGPLSSPFGYPDYLSSSVPKSALPNNNNNNSSSNNGTNGGSIHIGALSSTLGSLSLAPSSPSVTVSSLSTSLYSYSNGNSTSPGIGSSSNVNCSSANGAGQEEISTIFVVGFPDDMQEREFQNMFVFTAGFEAATLKIPNKDQQEDDALTMGVNGINPRKQIIGFAKFRTHQEALTARDVLNGRRVDAEKGSMLKAEMAKKNLHTRRGLSSNANTPDPISTPNLSSSVVSAAMPPTPISIANGSSTKLPLVLQHRNSLASPAAFDAFHSAPSCSPALPSDLLSPNDYPGGYDFFSEVYTPSNASALPFPESFGARHQSSDLSSSFLGRQSTFDMGRVDPMSMSGSLSNMNGGSVHPLGMSVGHGGSMAGSFSNSISTSFSNNTNNISNNGRTINLGAPQRFNKGFLDMDSDPSPVLTATTTASFLSKSIPAHTERGFNNIGAFTSDDLSANRFQGMPINTGASPAAAAVTMASPSLPSPNVGLVTPGYRVPVNPGDQNPPCNTLYVGNLPMNTSEDELRTLFSRCVGYRRLCFRTKSNGPMCFVEFENVECATVAMNELHGSPLSNSIKGGIRLSFSKNPLGVRSSSNANQLSPIGNVNLSSSLSNQLHGINGAPYLDRRDSMSAMFDQHY